MHQIKTGGFAFIISLIFVSTSFGQNTVSPYSAYGIGIVSDKAYTSNIGMGKAGLAYNSPWYINSLNPALFSDQKLTSFEAGLAFRNTAIRDEINRFDQTSGGLQFIALALPIIPNKLGLSISLNPYVSKNYSIYQNFDESIKLRPITKLYSGEGNISQFRLATGYNINKSFSLGVEVNYNFGLITERIQSFGIIDDQDTIATLYNVSLEETFNYADLNFILGARYKYKVSEDKTLSLGATYALNDKLNTTRTKSLKYLSFSGTPFNNDNLGNSEYLDEEGETIVPGKVSVGIAYSKLNKWAVLADYSYQDWSTFKQYGQPESSLGPGSSINLGGELTPNATSSDKYLKRVTYRAGFFYENGPITIESTAINNFGITFGVTAPINKISNMNLGIQVGQRGTLENSLVKENYFGMSLSFTFNDRWFLRRQFD